MIYFALMFVQQPLHKNTIGAASLAFRLLLNPHSTFTRRGYICVGGFISLSKHVFRHLLVLLVTWNFLILKVVYRASVMVVLLWAFTTCHTGNLTLLDAKNK